MLKKLENMSNQDVIDAVETNIRELSTVWGHAIHAKFSAEPEATWYVSGVPFITHNWVTQTQFTANTSQSKIDEILNRINAHQVPFLWIVDSSSSSDFLNHIKEHGWQGGPTAIQVRDIETLDEENICSEEVTVELVNNSETMKQWTRAFVSGYGGVPEVVFEHTVELLHTYGFVQHSATRYYLGRLNGEPVTSTLLFLGGGVAGIYNVATLPHARRHGIARSVTLAALQGARDMGYHTVTLQATNMGLSVYQHLGFKEQGAINFYILPGKPEHS